MKPSGRVDQVTVEFVDRCVDLAAPMKGLESRSSKNTCTEPLAGKSSCGRPPFAGERIVGRADARQQQQPRC